MNLYGARLRMHKILSLLLIVSCFSLSACSFIKKHNVVGDQALVYRQATADSPLKVPSDLNRNKMGSETDVLPANIPANSLAQMPLPPGSLADQIATGKTPKSALDVKLYSFS